MSLIKVYPAQLIYSHSFQGANRVLAPFEQFNAFFYDLLPKVLQQQIEQVDSIDKATCVVYPVADFTQLVEAFSHIRNTRPPCSALVSYIRETIDPQENGTLAFILRNTPDNCWLLVNAYDNTFPKRVEFAKVLTMDTFVGLDQRIGKVNTALQEKPVSMLAGALENRLERAYAIAKCYEAGLQDKLFITSLYSDATRDNLLELVDQVPRARIVKSAIDIGVFKHNVVDRDGWQIDAVQADTLYTQGHEFWIPSQVLTSKLNVVLETRWWAPSVTEKIFKPIVAGVPFVWFGYPNLGRYLSSHGYREYKSLDYTFDTLEDRFDRIDAMVDQITLVADGCDPRDDETVRHNQAQYQLHFRDFHHGTHHHALLTTLSGHRPV